MKPKRRITTALDRPQPLKKPPAKGKKPPSVKTAMSGYGGEGCSGNG